MVAPRNLFTDLEIDATAEHPYAAVEQWIAERFDFERLNALVVDSCRVAAQEPLALYRYMQRYTHFNGYAGSLVALLAGSIGASRELFMDPATEVVDEADRGVTIAAHVFSATIDEHHDKSYRVTHRMLAQAMLKAIGDFAGLSAEERNRMADKPQWYLDLIQGAIDTYPGRVGDVKALFQAMGCHCASELLADREYSLMDRVIRKEHGDRGFFRYFKESSKHVEIAGASLNTYCWIPLHGEHAKSGVEHDHFEAAVKAMDLAAMYRPEPRELLRQWVLEGFQAFVDAQQGLFREMQRECDELRRAASA